MNGGRQDNGVCTYIHYTIKTHHSSDRNLFNNNKEWAEMASDYTHWLLSLCVIFNLESKNIIQIAKFY